MKRKDFTMQEKENYAKKMILTLNESVVDKINFLAKDYGLAKSNIVAIAINDFFINYQNKKENKN